MTLQRISNWNAFVHLFSSAGKNVPFFLNFYLYSRVLADFYKFHWTSTIYATLTMRNRFLRAGADFINLGCIYRQNSHTTVAASYIMITKGPQLISKTNIPLLIPGWWRLCTDIKTAYACGCGNESVRIIIIELQSMKSTALAVGIWIIGPQNDEGEKGVLAIQTIKRYTNKNVWWMTSDWVDKPYCPS